jgi:hypothetical protein
MFGIKVHLYIKFRAFFRDLYKLDKGWIVWADGKASEFKPVSGEKYDKVLWNANGIRLEFTVKTEA